ncbi:MAG: MliC family protein [Devosia sp.]|nr:MliC family protein [Devosia sp.]
MEMLPLAAAAMMGGVDVSAQIVLSLQGNFERNVVRYECEGLEPFAVDYINAQPNFLAILPVGNQKLVFVSTIAASGVRYASGRYEWWTKGGDATLTDFTAAEGTGPVACLEVTETP